MTTSRMDVRVATIADENKLDLTSLFRLTALKGSGAETAAAVVDLEVSGRQFSASFHR